MSGGFTNRFNKTKTSNKPTENSDNLEQNEESVKSSDATKEETIEIQINPLEDENKKLKETLMRTLADLDNTRKREAKEKEDIKKYAVANLAKDLVGIMENFELAFENIKDENIDKNFYDGVKLIKSELKKIFDKNEILRVYPLNEDFNPELHEAIAHIESDVEEGKVANVMQAGWVINGRILKPAMVAVSKGKKADDGDK
ncbi:MAG: nucleotide exchange factor GrpE [Rickettsiales bacterium]|jgi:molecular chaperone GrpE|nr:nucleotide exchange factor GrpE [Rickettsiales bacterium]